MHPPARLDCVTGAFGFSGRFVARRLAELGRGVRTLTNKAPPPDTAIDVRPLAFGDEATLASHLEGVHTLFNTYWVRFAHGGTDYEGAVRNTLRLFGAARRAGVVRMVHTSIANPALDSPLAYYRGKAELEAALIDSGQSHAIVRPTVLFGDGGILIHNIAWLLRRLPFFAIAGDGAYRLQPIYVDDFAAQLIAAGDAPGNVVTDAAGPEIYRFEELVELLRDAVGSRARTVHVSPRGTLALAKVLGWFLRDVLITPDELEGLAADLLVSREPPVGTTRLSAWLRGEGEGVGRRYLSELAAHYRPAGGARG